MYLAIRYYDIKKDSISKFQEINDPSAEIKILKQSVKEYKDALDSKAEEVDELLDKIDKEQAKQKITESTESEWQQSKQQSQRAADSLQWDEAKTRTLLIDTMLMQAGWDLNDKDQVTC